MRHDFVYMTTLQVDKIEAVAAQVSVRPHQLAGLPFAYSKSRLCSKAGQPCQSAVPSDAVSVLASVAVDLGLACGAHQRFSQT